MLASDIYILKICNTLFRLIMQNFFLEMLCKSHVLVSIDFRESSLLWEIWIWTHMQTQSIEFELIHKKPSSQCLHLLWLVQFMSTSLHICWKWPFLSLSFSTSSKVFICFSGLQESLFMEPERKMFMAMARTGIQGTNGTPHRFGILASGTNNLYLNVPRNNKGIVIT